MVGVFTEYWQDGGTTDLIYSPLPRSAETHSCFEFPERFSPFLPEFWPPGEQFGPSQRPRGYRVGCAMNETGT